MAPLVAGVLALLAGGPLPAADGIPVVVRWNGAPAAGVQVWAFDGYADPKTAKPAVPLVTDRAGAVRVPRPAATDRGAALALFARGPAGRVAGVLFPAHEPPSAAVTLDLRDTIAWAGRITGPDGRPAAGIAVTVRSFTGPARRVPDPGEGANIIVPPGDREPFQRTTGADGAFAFSGVPVGLLAHVRLTGPGAGDRTAMVHTDKPLAVKLEAPGAIRLAFRGADAAAAEGMTYALSNAAAMQGWGPAADGTPRFQVWRSGKLDGTAGFVVADLPPGDYSFSLEGGGAVPTLAKKVGSVKVPAGPVVEVPVELVPLAKTAGRVVDAETGRPIAGAKVGVTPADPERGTTDDYPYRTAETDADGRYVFYAPAGFTVAAGGSHYGRMAAGYLPPEYKSGALPTPPVKLTAAGHTFPDIKLRKSATFAARIVDADDKPVAAAVVRPARVTDHHLPKVVTAGADGVVRIPDLDPRDLIAVRVRQGDAVNVPEAVEIGAADRPTVRLAKANAIAIAGRVDGGSGKPVAGAKVALHWMYRGVGQNSTMSTSTTFETLTSDAAGRFRSTALWPGDDYWVVVTAPGFAAVESQHVRGEAGRTHDLAVKLAAADLAVKGRVVDLSGKPVAGVKVFNRSDGEKPMEAKTDAAGTFTLTGYRAGPAFVFASHPGHRLAVAPTDPAGPAVTLTLRKTTDAPAAPPDLTAHKAALDTLTREVFAAMWAGRAALGGFERSVFAAFARFDPAAAETAADEAKRAGDKTDYAALLAQTEAAAKLTGVAQDDPDEALALVAKRKGSDGCRVVLTLAKQVRLTDPAKGLQLAEEAVQRARALDMPERAYYLAEAGSVAARCGNAAGGKAIIAEAAGLAEKLPAEGMNGLYRGYVAADLAPFDRPRALAMLAAHKKPSDYNRYLAQAADRVAVADPAAAEKMLGEFRPDSGFERHEGRMFVAYRRAASDPDAAAKLLAGVTHDHYRTLGYYRLARVVARTDKPKAWKLLDTAFAEYDAAPEGFDSWSGSGGRSALLAVGASVARDLDYPDVTGVVARVLLHRPTAQEASSLEYRDRQLVMVALALSFADPATARRVLASVKPPAEFAVGAKFGRRSDLFAAAFVVPEHAMKAVTPRLADFKNGHSGLVELFDALAAADRLAGAARWESLARVNHEWEE